ncbi:MAG: maleylpyruvate isomerase family mycothiol-dependent enzyme [Acidimicrobiales bacterium]
MLPQAEVVGGIQRELEDFADLVRSLDERDWARPSRCEGWTVSDVAGHLVGAFADITSGQIEGQGTAEVSERQAAERRGRTAGEVADELDRVGKLMVKMVASFSDSTWARQAGGGYALTVGQAMEAFWCGAYVHADDIRAAVGRPSERGPGLRAGVHHVADLLTQRTWGPAVLAFDGLEEVRVGDADGASARRITGDPLAFLLVATGRADPAPLGLDASVNVFASA